MERTISTKDIKVLKFAIVGILLVLLFGTCYSTVYTSVARSNCYIKARGAMGAPDGTHAILQGDNGVINSAAYSTYFSMCMNHEYGLGS